MVDNGIAKLGPDVQNIMGKTEANRDVPGIVDTVETTATCFFFSPTRRGIVPGFHGHTNDFVTFVVQHHRCQRRVDAATHGDQNASVFAHFVI